MNEALRIAREALASGDPYYDSELIEEYERALIAIEAELVKAGAA